MRKSTCDAVEEVRWKVIKAMLDDFPTLRERLRNYLKKKQNRDQ